MIPPISSPQGSLEELFRHHLLESEAAAVPPLPHVWEQLDNSLLLAENKRYRRRLAAYRWAMAASLLLTALASGGWWRSQHGAHQPAALATAAGPAGTTAPTAATRYPLAATSLGSSATLFSSSLTSAPIEPTLTFSTLSLSTLNQDALAAAELAAYYRATPAGRRRLGLTGRSYAAPATLGASAAALPLGPGTEAEATYTLASWANQAAASEAATTGQEADLLGTRLAALQLPAGSKLPKRLEARGLQLPSLRKPTRPWQLQVAYAGGLFDPNIDFEKLPHEYDGSLGPGTVATTREAAAEYRHNLHPGLGQRLSVWATRRLGIGRWNLRTGLEIAQNTASSASSVGFVGEQVNTLSATVQVQSNHLRGTDYRYRSVSLPVEAIYTSPLHRGFSLYGRMGALVTSLLNVHSEVDGNPEATRNYSIRSAGSPYRHVTASVRGGVGMRYEPESRQWALNLGPVAEAGVMSLNIDPTQTFWNQHRPYSFGLEAGVEFSSLLKPAAPVAAP